MLAYPDKWTMRSARDSLQQIYGFFSRRAKMEYDIRSISSDYIIENIEQAFESWKNPWAKHVGFQDFCEFILPYRILTEPVSNWRVQLKNKYNWVIDSIQNTDDPLEACNLVNTEITNWFSYNSLFDYHTRLSLNQLLEQKRGNCDDMASITTYIMRSVGIPVVSDFVPYWGKSDQGHRWNAILTSAGRTLPFGGADAKNFPSPPELMDTPLSEAFRNSGLPKVYRTTFESQKNSLAFIRTKDETIPPFFENVAVKDVTGFYVNSIDVKVDLAEKPPLNTRFVYLCVFNRGDWQAVHWSEIADGKYAVFSDMGPDIIYRPMYYNGDFIPASAPFLLKPNGTLKSLEPEDAGDTVLARCHRIGPWMWSATDPNTIHKGEYYELFCWRDNQWKSIGYQKALNNWLDFESVPVSGFFRIVKNRTEIGRIFIFDPYETTTYGLVQKFY
ncbi:MAG: transglutaminase-like domain-containing protein [Cytophagales bacterium]|nr:transglutaminase-like domain-containing protein [Cytophagales bacterium]